MEERRSYEAIAADVLLAQNGDAEALDRIIADVRDGVYFTCLRILKNEANAEDAAQDVLLAVCCKIGSLKDPGTYVAWVNRMTANRCKDILLRADHEIFLASDAIDDDPFVVFEDVDEQSVPDKAIDNAETQRMILELIDALPDEQRTCVMLFYYNEMKTCEIANALDVSEGTVKSRLNYARKAIREGVRKYEKQGIKLYGLSPIPFLRYFLGKALDGSKAKAAGIAARVTKTAAAGTAAATGTAAAGTASGGAFAAIAGRIAAGIVSIGILGGIGFGVFKLLDHRRIDPSPVIAETEDPTATAVAEATAAPPATADPTPETPAAPPETPDPTPRATDPTPRATVRPQATGTPSSAPGTPAAPATPTEAPTDAPTATPTQEPTWTEWSEEEPPSGAVSESRPQYRYRFTTTKVITESRVQHPYELMNQIEDEMRNNSYDDYAVQSQTQEWRGKRLYKTVETLAEAEAAAAESTDDYRYTYEENGDGQYDVYSETKYVVSSVFFCTDYSEWSDVYPEQVETHAGSLEVDSRQLWRYLR